MTPNASKQGKFGNLGAIFLSGDSRESIRVIRANRPIRTIKIGVSMANRFARIIRTTKGGHIFVHIFALYVGVGVAKKNSQFSYTVNLRLCSVCSWDGWPVLRTIVRKGLSWIAIASTSYRIEKRRNPEDWSKMAYVHFVPVLIKGEKPTPKNNPPQ